MKGHMPAKLAGASLAGTLLVSLLALTGCSQAAGADKLIPSIQGPALYKAYCASCHGADAKGKGPMAIILKVPPSDLTRISERAGGTFPLKQIENTITGVEPVSQGHGTREMPVWGPVFSQVDADRDLGRVRIDNLARYLRDIQAK